MFLLPGLGREFFISFFCEGYKRVKKCRVPAGRAVPFVGDEKAAHAVRAQKKSMVQNYDSRIFWENRIIFQNMYNVRPKFYDH